ncbi:MAG: hypothetical protein QM680_05305 [Luteolibacter sp.]
MNFMWGSLLLGSGLLLLPAPSFAQSERPDYELPPISYSKSRPHDAVARLLERIQKKEVGFTGPDKDVLQTVLRELDVPVESQIMVFSKTSMQGSLINPRNPRVLYFSDSVYVGWVPGGLIEVAAMDAELGPVYYTLDPQDARDARRAFVRETSCLRCHGENEGDEIPALLASSVLTTKEGEVIEGQGSKPMNESMPFKQRWGGWFVTGYTGAEDHLGNAHAQNPRPSDVSEFFDTSKYLVPTSDIRALLVFEHQASMHNVLTRSSHRARRALMSAQAPLDDHTRAILAEVAQEIVDHLLFKDAAPLPRGIETNADFQRAFTMEAPRDGKGCSLKDFSNKGRLFENRCSFLIYSESFAALPFQLKSVVFEQLRAALDVSTPNGRYGYLERDEREKIVMILAGTLPEDQSFFRGR